MMKALSRARLAALTAMVAAAAGCAGLYPYDDDDISWDQPKPWEDEDSPKPPPRVSVVPPPPISGGTLLVTADKAFAVAADPDRDRVSIIDLVTFDVNAILPLQTGDEPGRVTEGAPGTAHVALRRGGAVVTIDLATKEMHRRPVCAAPRGLAYDASTDLLHVACAGGELVTLSSDVAAPPVRELRLDRDLRDVIVQGDSLLVSRFRSSELLRVAKDGTVTQRFKPPAYLQSVPNGHGFDVREFEPAVAWRTVPLPGGGVVMVHQRGLVSPIDTERPNSYYSGNCRVTLVHTAVAVMRPMPGDDPQALALPAPGVGGIGEGLLPVDIAVSADGVNAVIAEAGTRRIFETPLTTLEHSDGLEPCSASEDQRVIEVDASGQPIAVGYDGDRNLLVQLREPPGIARFAALNGARTALLPLAGESRLDDSHALFHRSSHTSACASCHPEGQDDGRVWNFKPAGPRRTQSLAGGVLATAPLHWDGDLKDFDALIKEVLVHRMGTYPPEPEHVAAFAAWLDTIKDVPRSKPADEDAVARGEALFNDPTLACATCHSGELLTNGATVDVGTGKPFQVPSLRGLAARAPYMHDGCAATLRERFGPCGGGDKHGVTSSLTPAQIDDLVAYLETL
ncbi:c-type cytochrome [Sorangium sp. So ce1000]|uniref:c-type cytochrome n=1 Tax=Sorangium sp. So ce1000 TaxID=3133325 RepID=UPI003F60B9B1